MIMLKDDWASTTNDALLPTEEQIAQLENEIKALYKRQPFLDDFFDPDHIKEDIVELLSLGPDEMCESSNVFILLGYDCIDFINELGGKITEEEADWLCDASVELESVLEECGFQVQYENEYFRSLSTIISNAEAKSQEQHGPSDTPIGKERLIIE